MRRLYARFIAWWRPQYEIRVEHLAGKPYYMIYMRLYGLSGFLERWNSFSAANNRLQDLRTKYN